MQESAAAGIEQRNGMRRVSTRWGGVAALGAFVAFSVWRASPPPHPVDRVFQAAGFVDEKTCAECHQEEAASFARTGHAQTLQLATTPQSREVLRRIADTEPARLEGIRVDTQGDSIHAYHSREGRQHQLKLDWCFGSGRHARTWVGTLEDSRGAHDLVEFRWSWFHEDRGFAHTPGQPLKVSDTYFGGLGLLFDHPKTRRCFNCHCTYIPLDDGRLDSDRLIPNITCQRCHGPQQEHVDTEGEVSDTSWRNISQIDSVHRCAQCHRRADEMEPGQISADNDGIVRFQPVGLLQSACFKNSPKLTCLTCHDPHLPLEAQDSKGIWQCIQCHDGSPEKHSTCRAGHRDDCLRCHMPAVRGEVPVRFTDHWIRIRKPTKPAHTEPTP